MNIQFFNDAEKPFSFNEEKLKFWIHEIAQEHNKKIKYINFILLDDAGLLKINQDHLQHDFFTDIITFDLSENKKEIEAEIYISLERVADNSSTLQVQMHDEFNRVVIHGLLHLLGWKDSTEEEKKKMREAEDACLKKLVSRET